MLPLFTLFGFLGASAQWAAPESAALSPPTVVLDPGHGGYQPGARVRRGAYEKQLTLEVAELTRAELVRRGYRVLLTRSDDRYVPLGARRRFANDQRADVLVSIHCNDAPRSPDAQGIETYFLAQQASDAEAQALADKENDDPNIEPDDMGLLGTILSDLRRTNARIESELLAARLQGAAVRATGAKNRGVKQAPLAVLKRTEMAAVLIEIGFLTHKDERERLSDKAYQAKLAGGIADGIERFLKEPPDAPELPPPATAPLVSLGDRQQRLPATSDAPRAIHKSKKHAAATSPAKPAKTKHLAKQVKKQKPAMAKSPKKRRPAPTHAAR